MKGQRVFADKACASQENRRELKTQGLKDGIMHKAARGKALRFSQKLFNRLISKKRFIVEQGFGTLKRHFCFARASYMSRLKVAAQLRLKAICFNLLKAVNLSELLMKRNKKNWLYELKISFLIKEQKPRENKKTVLI